MRNKTLIIILLLAIIIMVYCFGCKTKFSSRVAIECKEGFESKLLCGADGCEELRFPLPLNILPNDVTGSSIIYETGNGEVTDDEDEVKDLRSSDSVLQSSTTEGTPNINGDQEFNSGTKNK